MKNYKSKSYVSDPVEFFKRILIRVSISILLSIIIAYSMKFFILFPFTITNDFMEPTYKKGSKVYLTYLFSKDKLLIGDVILVRSGNSSSVVLARIVARKGDRISLKNKKLYRNGNHIPETNIVQFNDKRAPFSGSFSNRDNLDEVLVKEKTYFLLVDNRDDGIDSRELGLISQDSILGKVIF